MKVQNFHSFKLWKKNSINFSRYQLGTSVVSTVGINTKVVLDNTAKFIKHAHFAKNNSEKFIKLAHFVKK